MARPSSKNQSWLRKFSAHRCAAARRSVSRNHGLYPEGYFQERLIQERRRAERLNRPLVMMVLDAGKLGEETEAIVDSLGESVTMSVRGTDICGFLTGGKTIGVILTEVETEKVDTAKKIVATKTADRLATSLSSEVASRVGISFRIYPDRGGSGEAFDMTFYPEVAAETAHKIGADALKRSLDIVGSIAGLLLFFPFFALLPALIKLNSKGPVFFRQERIGRNGRRFNVLKFRSMYLDNDDIIHREYVKRLIEGNISASEGGEAVFKIQGDPRVTPVGRYLRKFSLDELPQFINVLRGDMSLVGPRPPIKYELDNYFTWQRNRLVGKKPGITGLWQVTGRSSTSFDDMVRLDLRYLSNWSITLDLKILLRTPAAVLKCKGAY